MVEIGEFLVDFCLRKMWPNYLGGLNIPVVKKENLATILQLCVEDLKTWKLFAVFVGYLLRGYFFVNRFINFLK